MSETLRLFIQKASGQELSELCRLFADAALKIKQKQKEEKRSRKR